MSSDVTELGFPVDVVEAMEQAGRWPDLTRLKARRPEVIPLVCWLLGLQTPVREICKRLQLSASTVQEIGEKYADSVVTEKAGVAKLRRLALRLGMERIVEQAEAGKLGVFDLKLLWDMDQVEGGGVTSRTEVRYTAEDEQAFTEFEQLRQRARMVLEAEILPQAAPALAPSADLIPMPSNTRHGDSQAPDFVAESLMPQGIDNSSPETLHNPPPETHAIEATADQSLEAEPGGEGVEVSARS